MYKLDFLIDTFTRHAEENANSQKLQLKQFKANFPDQPIPEGLDDEFNLPLALASICKAIQELQNVK